MEDMNELMVLGHWWSNHHTAAGSSIQKRRPSSVSAQDIP